MKKLNFNDLEIPKGYEIEIEAKKALGFAPPTSKTEITPIEDITDPSLKALVSLNRHRNEAISNSIDRSTKKDEVIFSLKKELKGFIKSRK